MRAIQRKQDQRGCKTLGGLSLDKHCSVEPHPRPDPPPPPFFPPVQANVSMDVRHHSALCGSDYYAISNIWPFAFLRQQKFRSAIQYTTINHSLEFNSPTSRCHKTSLLCVVLLFGFGSTAAQSELNGYSANLLLSSSLAHASQAAAARISKENSGLFKHPMQTHTHCRLHK